MTQTDSKYKYVPVKVETKANLDSLGRKGQTYDEILKKLIEKWNEKN